MQILFCDTLLEVRIVYLMKTIINFIRFVVPIILIFKISVDVYKTVLSGEYDKNDAIKKSGDRIIASILIFLIPTIVNVFISFLGKIDNNAVEYNNTFSNCYTQMNKEMLDEFIEAENQALNQRALEEKQESELRIANREAEKKAQEEANKNANYSDNTTNLTKENLVYIKDGTFYYPTDIESGKNCPIDKDTSPTKGYNSYFYQMLTKFVEAAKQAGFTITIGSDGCRTYDKQKELSETYSNTPGRAAKPGRSMHGWGLASDLGFKGDGCDFGKRTEQSCKSMAWAHKNAEKFGLVFNLLDANYKEDWHIQPIKLKGYKIKGVNEEEK